MGIWGANTFDNDAASDFLDHAIEELREFIEDDLARSDEDGVLERPTLAAVACLRALMTSNLAPERAGVIVPATKVYRWRDAFLKWFDQNSSFFGADDAVVRDLRANAEHEFTVLLDYLKGSV